MDPYRQQMINMMRQDCGLGMGHQGAASLDQQTAQFSAFQQQQNMNPYQGGLMGPYWGEGGIMGQQSPWQNML